VATEAALSALDRAWSLLAPLGRPLAVIGGVALAAWNHVRATRDVDLLIAVDLAEIEPLLAVLRSHGFRPRHSPPVRAVGDLHFVQLLYTPPDEFYDVPLDLILAESALQRSALERRVQREVPGIRGPIDILRCDDLILFKLVAGRLIDLADAAMLLRENCDVLDLAYLRTWLDRLQLGAELAGVWREAFPDAQPPASLRS